MESDTQFLSSLSNCTSTHNIASKNQKTNIIVISGNDATLQNILSVIQKSGNYDELHGMKKHAITESREDNVEVPYKRCKADLTCVICENKCSGYNLGVISCKSCKSFFHRNASRNVNDLECLTNTNNCNVQFKNKRQMCRRCRLEKCLSVGMKRKSSLNEEEKLNKRRQLQENIRSRRNVITTSMQTNSIDVSYDKNKHSMNNFVTMLDLQNEIITEQLPTTWLCTGKKPVPYSQKLSLTLDDYNRLKSVKLSYKRAFRFIEVKRDITALNHIIDQRSALLYSISIFCNTGIRLITFIRNIPEFQLLNEEDRFILFKYNFPIIFFMRTCLNYDRNRDHLFESEVKSEEHAIACKYISRYCYGEQLSLQSGKLFHSIKKIVDDDSTILQLMMVILTFTKSVSLEDIITKEESILLNNKQIYEVQSTYTNLLFHYMIAKYSNYYQAARQYSQLIQKIVQMQVLLRSYRQFFQERLVDTRDDDLSNLCYLCMLNAKTT